MVWSQLERRKIISRFPDSHNAEISKSLGRTWRGLTPEERRPFLEEADRLKMLHSREFPHYKYQPKKKSRLIKVPGAKETLKIQVVRKCNQRYDQKCTKIFERDQHVLMQLGDCGLRGFSAATEPLNKLTKESSPNWLQENFMLTC